MYRIFLLLLIVIGLTGCGVYSLSGASIEGKTINIHVLENRARNVVPSLSPALTTRIRGRIISQTGLASVNNDQADYNIAGYISMYEVTVTGAQGGQNSNQAIQATQNRLTISVNITFTNNLDEKANFTQTFTRFADFPATRTLQAEEPRLIESIANELADDIFKKAFVNW